MAKHLQGDRFLLAELRDQRRYEVELHRTSQRRLICANVKLVRRNQCV